MDHGDVSTLNRDAPHPPHSTAGPEAQQGVRPCSAVTGLWCRKARGNCLEQGSEERVGHGRRRVQTGFGPELHSTGEESLCSQTHLDHRLASEPGSGTGQKYIFPLT